MLTRHRLALAALCLTASLAPAQTARVQVPFKEFKLKNGLRVLLAEDHAAPTYSIAVTYNVGSRDERAGRTGFAHLFEHMMFQGSENVGKGEHFILVLNNGGNMNGTTNQDRTNYFETLPANQLDLGLFLESDRMRSLNVNQANLDNQRNAVQEERRLGVDNRPYGLVFETLLDTAYDNFAYKHSTIGSMSDLNAASVSDVQQFFKTYYAPNNAVVALVGDFTTADALAKVTKYFEPIPSQTPPPPVNATEAPQKAERTKTIEDKFAQLPLVFAAYKTVPGNTADWYALSVLARILGGGQASRLYQSLVKEKQVAVQVGSFELESRGSSLFATQMVPRPGKDPKETQAAAIAEIERVKSEGVTDAEMQRAFAEYRSQHVGQLEGTLFRAQALSQDTVFYGDPSLINTIEDKFRRVTKADVQRVAKTYLTDNNRTLITDLPASRPTGAAAAGR